jgi:hypothetical protein
LSCSSTYRCSTEHEVQQAGQSDQPALLRRHLGKRSRAYRTEKGQEKQAYSVFGCRKPAWVIWSDPFLHVFGSAVSEKIIMSFLVETIMKSIPLYISLQTTVKRISISTYLEKHKA